MGHNSGSCIDCTHGEEFRKKFGGEQRVIGGPEFRGSRDESLVIDSQFLGDFRTRDNFPKSLVPFWVWGLGVEISFDLGRGLGSEDKGNDLAFDKVKVNRCRKTQVTLLCQVQELYVDLRNGNTVDDALRDIPEVKGEVLGNEKSLVVGSRLVDRTGNGTVWKDVGVVFVTSVIECRCDFDSEGEDTSDHLNRREIVIGKGDRRDAGKY